MRIKTFTLLFIFPLISVITVVSVRAETVDFKDLSQTKDKELPSLLDKRKSLWSGKANSLQFETGRLSNELLIVSATSNRIHVNTGQDLNLTRGSLTKRMPGRILFLDLHTVKRRPDIALVTVTILSQDTLRSTVFSLRRRSNGKLSFKSFHSTNWTLIRPVGSRLYRQQYDIQSLWVDSIQELKTTETGYTPGEALNLPSGSRLSSLTRIGTERWVLIDREGNLLLRENGQITATIKGDFGASIHNIKPINKNWRNSNTMEPLRLPPVHLKNQDLFAAIFNPLSQGGVMDWITGGSNSSSIELFRLNNNSLQYHGSIGPFRRRVLDLDVPSANPDQLLWLRRSGQKTVILEMIDFSQVNRD